jgi:hypothetical protein
LMTSKNRTSSWSLQSLKRSSKCSQVSSVCMENVCSYQQIKRFRLKLKWLKINYTGHRSKPTRYLPQRSQSHIWATCPRREQSRGSAHQHSRSVRVWISRWHKMTAKLHRICKEWISLHM